MEDRWQGKGLGTALFTELLRVAESRGIRVFRADVLADNARMLDLTRFGDVQLRETRGALTAVAIVTAVLLSEAASNTASASVIVPVMIAVAQGMGVSPVPPAVGAALGASFGFMLPVSTPPNAIVFGSGLVPLPEMIRAGIFLDLAGIAVIWLGLRLLCPVLGLE